MNATWPAEITSVGQVGHELPFVLPVVDGTEKIGPAFEETGQVYPIEDVSPELVAIVVEALLLDLILACVNVAIGLQRDHKELIDGHLTVRCSGDVQHLNVFIHVLVA